MAREIFLVFLYRNKSYFEIWYIKLYLPILTKFIKYLSIPYLPNAAFILYGSVVFQHFS